MPRKKSHEKTGIRSYHANCVLHEGQAERVQTISFSKTNRYARTFKNEPQQRKKGIRKKMHGSYMKTPNYYIWHPEFIEGFFKSTIG
jgi:hypothetical protein